MSVPANRIAIASRLYSARLITEISYDEATESNNKLGLERGTALVNAIKAIISTLPESLERLIDVLKRLEPFQQIAHKLEEDTYH